MTKFERRFFKYLNEADITDDREAMLGMLDKETDPSEFEVDLTPEESSDMASAANSMARIQQQNNAKESRQVLEWIQELDEVVERLNGLESDSYINMISKGVPDSIMDKLKKQTSTIETVSKGITDLIQSFQSAIGSIGSTKSV
jgi:hypothetical protein